MKSNLPKVSLLQVVKWNLDNPSTQAYLAECYVNKITFSYLIKICEKKNPAAILIFVAGLWNIFLDAYWLCDWHVTYTRKKNEETWRPTTLLFVLTSTVVLRGGGRGQQGVVVLQLLGVEHVEAWNERGWRAVHPLLLCRLHGLRGIQQVWRGVSVRKRQQWETNRADQGREENQSTCLTSRRLRRWERDWRRGSRRPQACR